MEKQRTDYNHAIAKAYKALFIIQKLDLVKAEYLAEELDVSLKQVYRYIKAMKEAGIKIKSKSGAKGGYYLEECPFCGKDLKQ